MAPGGNPSPPPMFGKTAVMHAGVLACPKWGLAHKPFCKRISKGARSPANPFLASQTRSVMLLPGTVSGFKLEKKFYPEDPNMQMRTIRAYLLRAEEGELVSQVLLRLKALLPEAGDGARAWAAVRVRLGFDWGSGWGWHSGWSVAWCWCSGLRVDT